MPGIFKKNDIRGKVGDELNPEFAEKLGFLFIQHVRSDKIPTVAIAGDTRKSTPGLVEALIKGMRKAGADVYDLGIGPTPLIYFVAAHNNLISQSIMVTGSHNPPDQNGIKISNEKGQSYHYENLFKFLEIGLQQFNDMYPNFVDLGLEGEKLDGSQLKKVYFNYLSNEIKLKNNLKIIVDYGKGATLGFSEVLDKLELDYSELGIEVDGTFEGLPPDPAKPHTYDKLKKHISDEHIGIAFDTDGDRVGFMTKQKEIISPDQIAMLFADSVKLNNKSPRVIIDVKVSKATAEYVNEIGGVTILSQVGHSYIHENLIKNKADIAAELSGHYYFNDRYYGFDDGLYAAIRFIEILDQLLEYGITLEDKLQKLPKFYSTPEYRDEISYEKIEKILKETEKMVIEEEKGEITKIDGLRAELKDGWFLMRKSGTEEILSYRVEGNDESSKNRILNRLKSIISKY